MSTSSDFEVERAIDSAKSILNIIQVETLQPNNETYLSFSVPKIEAKYSAIFYISMANTQ